MQHEASVLSYLPGSFFRVDTLRCVTTQASARFSTSFRGPFTVRWKRTISVTAGGTRSNSYAHVCSSSTSSWPTKFWPISRPSKIWSVSFAKRWVSPSTSFRRSEEHTSELQSRGHLVCRLLLEKKNYI